MKRISRILSLVIVVGMIAAIPASTQILFGSRGEASDESNLPMLILVNRLEMSEEQMEGVLGILTDLLAERAQLEGHLSEFEDAMIEFRGTGEELDEMLATFRQDQGGLAEALRESIEASLDEVRDILSINQGIALREGIPELRGGGALLNSDRGGDRRENTAGMMGSRMPLQPMGRAGTRGEQIQQTPHGRQWQSPMIQRSTRMNGRNGACEDDSQLIMMQDSYWRDVTSSTMKERSERDVPSNMMQQRFSSGAVPEMFDERLGRSIENTDIGTMRGQRFGQDIDDEAIGTMREQMEDRLEQLGDHAPEELRERLEDRLGVAIEDPGTRPSLPAAGNLGQMGFRVHTMMPDHNSMEQPDDVNLFGLLKQVADVLELKLGAME